jgi:hypothetical protein
MRHLKTKHGCFADRDAEYFKRNIEIVKKTEVDSCGSYQEKTAAVEALYLVAQRTAKAKRPH